MRNKKDDIAAKLREEITSGTYGPGDRLPTRVELERSFGVSSNTVQLALDALIAEGYVTPCGKRGSFVADSPPHLTRICLLYVEDFLAACGRNRQFRAIRDALPGVERRYGVRFELFDNAGLLGNAPKIDRLIEDVRARRLAGIFFLSDASSLRNTPIFEAPGIARTMLGTRSFGFPAFYPDYLDFHRKAAAQLREWGVKNPLVIVDSMLSPEVCPEILRIYRGVGLPLASHQLQFMLTLPDSEPFAALIDLAWRSSAPPDSVVLADDNRLPCLTARLRSYGIEHFPVIAMANFPYPTESAFPVVRIGFDVSGLLATATRLIRAQLDGRAVPSNSLIPAEIESAATLENKGESWT